MTEIINAGYDGGALESNSKQDTSESKHDTKEQTLGEENGFIHGEKIEPLQENKKELFEEFERTEALFAKLVAHTAQVTVNINELSPTRVHHNGEQIGTSTCVSETPVLVSGKTGSLELSLNTKENTTRMDKFTEHYMNYFTILGHPDNTDEFEYEYVDSLTRESDVNRTDIHGQSVIHEIARDWHTDVCLFLKSRGVDIDLQDDWGRTPLYVAVASNNVAMVKWLVANGADINHRTIKGEGQLPIHYAGKFDSVEAFDVLVELGSSPLARDDHDRTPFFLAAEAGNERICEHFLDIELPVVSYDDTGVSIIDNIVSNLPTAFTEKAFDQFISVSAMDNSLLKVYLSCLGKGRWRMLRQKKDDAKTIPVTIAPDVLELIIEKNDLELIAHPVIVKLIQMKRQQYGKKSIWLINLANLLFTLLWTWSAAYGLGNISVVKKVTDEHRNYVLFITIASQLFTFPFMYRLYLEWKVKKKFYLNNRRRKCAQIYTSENYCHPRWPGDKSAQEVQLDMLGNMKFRFWDGWTILEAVCLLLSCGFTVVTIVWYMNPESWTYHLMRLIYSTFFVLIVWFRLNRGFKCNQTFGPFVEMLEECGIASTRIGFLFFEFTIPFSVAFWVFFGAKEVEGGSVEYMRFNDLLYQLWLLSFIGDYELDTLLKIDRLSAQILVGLYLVLVSIITINIYIALLSEAYARVVETASQRAYMSEAALYNKIERILPDIKTQFEAYLNQHCAPLVIDSKEMPARWGGGELGTREVVSSVAKTTSDLKNSLMKIHEGELSMRKDVNELEDTFNGFRSKYDSAMTKTLLKRVRTVMGERSMLIGMLKRGDNIVTHIVSLRSKVEEIYYDYVTRKES